MKTAYARDNTRSSIAIVLSIALAVALIATLFGLSDKPDVSTIAVVPSGQVPNGAAAVSVSSEQDDEAEEATNAELSTADDEQDAAATQANNTQAIDTETIDTADTDADGQLDDPAPRTDVTVIPTAEPTATAEVAAAVAPTAVSLEGAAASDAVQAAPALPTETGSVQGTFFTKGDENDGALVAQNLITVSFSQDGSGAFQGVLDITYVDGTHILMNMSGPLQWAPSNPQVEATLTGAFTLDAPIDTDDVTDSNAELSISSLSAGSGSLCTSKCFGFTFPPQ